MIVVTGGAGFIGSNLVRALNARGRDDILVVDDLEQGDKFRNLVGAKIADYIDHEDFLKVIGRGADVPATWVRKIEAVMHQGACSDTTVRDGRYMMRQNYTYSKEMFGLAQRLGVPFIYASSAAVYGGQPRFVEASDCEGPLNVYGWSKLLFDDWVRRQVVRGQVVGLRYFNVYGPGENHKGTMASVALHFHQQLLKTDQVRLFEGTDGYGDGEQRRDFIHVDDVVAVNLWFLDHTERTGIFNVGTGQCASFNDVARAVIRFHGRGDVVYIPMPEVLRGSYQSFTEADLTRLRTHGGYEAPFKSIDDGIHAYLTSVMA
jgi:ADP-L-glycero-D-manno-heptose 6-epimerase